MTAFYCLSLINVYTSDVQATTHSSNTTILFISYNVICEIFAKRTLINRLRSAKIGHFINKKDKSTKSKHQIAPTSLGATSFREILPLI